MTNLDRLTQISWMILEAKAMYYLPHLVHLSRRDDYIIPDSMYDEIEREHKRLCFKLFDPEHAQWRHEYTCCVGHPPLDRPSFQLVLKKLGSKKIENTNTGRRSQRT